MNKILCNTLIIIIMLGVFCNGYFGCSGLSFSDRVSYAEADNWSSCDTSDLVTAFRYYCKSRNLAIEGSIADALTGFTTTTFNNICSTLGIDPTSLSAELKKTTQGNLGLRFLFSQNGITAYNRIFAEFLQNNDLDVGDEVSNKVVYSGKYFTDDDGNTCSVYVLDSTGIRDFNQSRNKILQYGTKYIYDSNDLISIVPLNTYQNFSVHIGGNTYTGDKTSLGSLSNGLGITYADKFPNGASIGYSYVSFYDRYYPMYKSNDSSIVGSFAVFLLSNNKLGVGSISFPDSSTFSYSLILLDETVEDTEDGNVYITTNNNTINNNSYNNNYVIIYNDGDTYISDDDEEPLPTTPPDGGGGNDPDPDDPLDPYDPTKPFPDTPDYPTPDPGVVGGPGSDGTITLPDFNFDLPDINWSLDGLQHKFPFSLPFDLYNACKLLNAEPQTPELDYTVNLVVYQWPIQMDLHWLDPAARVIRIFELLAFVVGLILITRHLIGG